MDQSGLREQFGVDVIALIYELIRCNGTPTDQRYKEQVAVVKSMTVKDPTSDHKESKVTMLVKIIEKNVVKLAYSKCCNDTQWQLPTRLENASFRMFQCCPHWIRYVICVSFRRRKL